MGILRLDTWQSTESALLSLSLWTANNQETQSFSVAFSSLRTEFDMQVAHGDSTALGLPQVLHFN